MMLPQAPAVPQAPQAGATRVHEALFSGLGDKLKKEREIELDARLTVSDREVLQKKDFAQMTTAEIAAAKEAMKRLVLPLAEIRTRHLAPQPRYHLIDIRRTLSASMKGGGDFIHLHFIEQKTKPPPFMLARKVRRMSTTWPRRTGASLRDFTSSSGSTRRFIASLAHAIAAVVICAKSFFCRTSRSETVSRASISVSRSLRSLSSSPENSASCTRVAPACGGCGGADGACGSIIANSWSI